MFTGSSQILHFMDANLKKNLRQFTVVYGIVITALLALAFIPKYSGIFIEKGFTEAIKQTGRTFVEFTDDPTPFFLSYFVGYILIWWRPLVGSFLIFCGSVFYFYVSHNTGSLIFVIPGFLVGVLYVATWIIKKRS